MNITDLKVGVEYAYRYKNKAGPEYLGKLRLLDTAKSVTRRSEGGWNERSKNIPALPAEAWGEEYTQNYNDGSVKVNPAGWYKTAVLPREILGPWSEYEAEYLAHRQAQEARRIEREVKEAQARANVMAFAAHGFEVGLRHDTAVVIAAQDIPEVLRLLALAKELEDDA